MQNFKTPQITGAVVKPPFLWHTNQMVWSCSNWCNWPPHPPPPPPPAILLSSGKMKIIWQMSGSPVAKSLWDGSGQAWWSGGRRKQPERREKYVAQWQEQVCAQCFHHATIFSPIGKQRQISTFFLRNASQGSGTQDDTAWACREKSLPVCELAFIAGQQ